MTPLCTQVPCLTSTKLHDYRRIMKSFHLVEFPSACLFLENPWGWVNQSSLGRNDAVGSQRYCCTCLKSGTSVASKTIHIDMMVYPSFKHVISLLSVHSQVSYDAIWSALHPRDYTQCAILWRNMQITVFTASIWTVNITPKTYHFEEFLSIQSLFQTLSFCPVWQFK